MTTPATTAQSAPEYQAAQSALADLLGAQVLAVWERLLDVGQLKRTLPDFTAAVAALVQRFGSASAAVAADYYDAARLAAAVKGSYSVVPAPPAPFEQTAKGVGWATRGLWSAQPDTAAAQVLVRGVATTQALDAGRDTIVQSVAGDRQARGWARHVEPGACSFCLLLGTRGPAYRSKETASFEAHDHCRCQPEPVFGPWEATADMRHWEAVYRQAAKAGSGAVVRNEFRRLVEAERAGSGPARGEGTPHGG